MKHTVFLICAVLTASVFAGSAVDEQISKLEQEKTIVRNQLIAQRAKEIKEDKRLEKLANEILRLNLELSEYLDTKPEIKKLNRKYQQINRSLKELRETKTPAGDTAGTNGK